jgi:hypothetical protein
MVEFIALVCRKEGKGKRPFEEQPCLSEEAIESWAMD